MEPSPLDVDTQFDLFLSSLRGKRTYYLPVYLLELDDDEPCKNTERNVEVLVQETTNVSEVSPTLVRKILLWRVCVHNIMYYGRYLIFCIMVTIPNIFV